MKNFDKLLNKVIASKNYKINGISGVEVLSVDGRLLKCKLGKEEFDHYVDQIKASTKDSGAVCDLIMNQEELKKPAKTKKKKEVETKETETQEDNKE